MGWNRDHNFYQRLLKYSGFIFANWQYKPAKCKNLIVFQMTEVAVPRALFREMLERISRLRLAAVTLGTG